MASQDEPVKRWGHLNLSGCFLPQYQRRDFYTLRIAYWWGAMAIAWNMVEAWEASQRARVELVVFLRANVQFMEPLVAPKGGFDAQRIWSVAGNPPDSLWIFSRPVAKDVLTTLTGAIIRCGSTVGRREALDMDCCNASFRGGGPFKFSFFPTCFWALKHRHVRLERLLGVNASVQTVTAGKLWLGSAFGGDQPGTPNYVGRNGKACKPFARL
eukprot:1984484-Prymnesium_polylepis.1